MNHEAVKGELYLRGTLPTIPSFGDTGRFRNAVESRGITSAAKRDQKQTQPQRPAGTRDLFPIVIKSAKTTSRTLLPKNYVPRVALGTVQTTGPDQVGLHEHPMLEQLFLGLRGNDIIVHANEASAALGEFHLMVILHASLHGASVVEGKSLHYVWMDFFNDTAGQAWLDNHKDIAPGQKY